MQKDNYTSISNQYQIDRTNILGQGSTGQVYLGRSIQNKSPVAIKLIRLATIENEVTQYLFKMEKIALNSINHENVLRGFKIIQNSSKCYMVTQFCNGGTLKQHIQKKRKLGQQESINIIKGVLKGYNSLVRRKIVHRDLKPANVMLHDGSPKIIDFGYCQIQGHQRPNLQYNVGSPSYMAPQSFQQNIYNQKSEIWSIGIILYECLHGKTFDDGKHMGVVYKQLRKNGIPFSAQISQKCKRIIQLCLEMNPTRRPTALELLDQLIEKPINLNKQPDFIILQKKKSISLFMSPQSGLTSKKSVSKSKLPKSPNVVGIVRHKRTDSGYSCIDDPSSLMRNTSRSNVNQKMTDRVILGEAKKKGEQFMKTQIKYVKNQYGLTSRDSRYTDQLKKKNSEYIFSPQTGFTCVSNTPKICQQIKKQVGKYPNTKIQVLQKNPESLGSSKQNKSNRQVPFEQYFLDTKNTLVQKKSQYVSFDYRKVYSQKGKLKMTLKKQNSNNDLGQYLFSNYISPSGQHHELIYANKEQYISQKPQMVNVNAKIPLVHMSSQNQYGIHKKKPVSFFSKIFSPFHQKTFR